MKTILFAYSPSDCTTGKCINLLGQKNIQDLNMNGNLEMIELTALWNHFDQEWFEQFVVWLSSLNCNNAGLLWWAHIATAKNLLSSSLGQHYFQVRAVCEIARREDFSILHVLGATPGQMAAISLLLSDFEFQFTGRAWKFRFLHKLMDNIKTIVKQFIRVVNVFVAFFNYRGLKQTDPLDLCLFTYFDGVRRVGIDNYFGQLPKLLLDHSKLSSVIYLAFIDGTYRKRLKQISQERNAAPYVALYGQLRSVDYGWVLWKTIKEWWLHTYSKYSLTQDFGEYTPLLREVFVNEIGGYFHNLLVYKAIGHFIKRYRPKVIVYPFENKSLEKMILLGAQSSGHRVKMVGYQHTSVTPRHASTLLFKVNEAAYTPLPDQIITVGKITRDYLEVHGNYPDGIFVTGGALRQIWRERLPRQHSANLRVLLALSSSKDELIQAVEFFKKVKSLIPDLELGIRPHINFSLTILPDALTKWVAANALDFSNTLLEDNMHWCNITAYVSSTVALESLMRGRPVVHFPIDEVVFSDPLLGEVPFCWHVHSHVEMQDVLMHVHKM